MNVPMPDPTEERIPVWLTREQRDLMAWWCLRTREQMQWQRDWATEVGAPPVDQTRLHKTLHDLELKLDAIAEQLRAQEVGR